MKKGRKIKAVPYQLIGLIEPDPLCNAGACATICGSLSKDRFLRSGRRRGRSKEKPKVLVCPSGCPSIRLNLKFLLLK